MDPGYTGIRNPGNLCYLISLLQNLYMMKDFRDLLSVHFSDESSDLTSSADLSTDDFPSQLHQAFLKLENRTSERDIDLSALWRSWLSPETDTTFTQRDSCEAYMEVLQRVDGGLGVPDCPILSGVVTNQLKMLSDSQNSQRLDREERFNHISLSVTPVDGKCSLQDSLLKFCEEIQVPYTWPAECKGLRMNSVPPQSDGSNSTILNTSPKLPGPVPSLLSAKFQILPQHLAFHLKRFTFNKRTLRKEKLHHEFKFPYFLDMRPFVSSSFVSKEDYQYTMSCTTHGVNSHTAEMSTSRASFLNFPAMKSDCLLYVLSGCIVHKGSSAYTGHYFAYVRERGKGEDDLRKAISLSGSVGCTASSAYEKLCNGIGRRWFKFDDEVVESSNIEQMYDDCHGVNRNCYTSYSESSSEADSNSDTDTSSDEESTVNCNSSTFSESSAECDDICSDGSIQCNYIGVDTSDCTSSNILTTRSGRTTPGGSQNFRSNGTANSSAAPVYQNSEYNTSDMKTTEANSHGKRGTCIRKNHRSRIPRSAVMLFYDRLY